MKRRNLTSLWQYLINNMALRGSSWRQYLAA